jgi:CheY-like chemotaxis protein
MKILVIEDEILIQQSLKKLLEKMGAIVSTESRGMEALSKIKSESFDRIVCDLMLQDITGFDIIEDSKSIFSSQEISQKFIIITAYSSEQVLTKAKDYGCIVLNKPFSDMKKALSIMFNGKDNGQ